MGQPESPGPVPRTQVESVQHNAQCVLKLVAEAAAEASGPAPPNGFFDAYIWSFVASDAVLALETCAMKNKARIGPGSSDGPGGGGAGVLTCPGPGSRDPLVRP